MPAEDKEQMFNDNIKLAYYVANRYRRNYPEEYDDILQVALLGLWKAIDRYNGKWALSTIAIKIMSNNINYYLRSVKRHRDNDISIHTILINNESNPITIEDQIADTEVDDLDTQIDLIILQDCINNGIFSPNEAVCIRYLYLGYTQKEIGNIIGVSQPQVSRYIKNVQRKLQKHTHSIHIKRKEQPMIHKLYLEEDSKGKKEIEFYCPETEEENKEMVNRIDDMIERINLMAYFGGKQ